MTLSKFTKQPANDEIVDTINDIIDTMGSTTGANIDLSNLSSTGNSKFQIPLVSGTNIKTINNTSLLGSGDISLVGDDTTISKNSDDELQAIGVIDDNSKNAYNFTVVGSPTITADGIASGFSDSNYLTFNAGNLTFNTFEFISPDIYIESVNNKYVYYTPSTANSCNIIISDRDFYIYWVDNGRQKYKRWSFGSVANHKYRLKLLVNSTSATVYCSTDGEQFTQIGTTEEIGYSKINCAGILGKHNSSGYAFTGSIDLKQFSITVDGVEVYKAWQPQALKYWTGTKTEYDAISSYDTTTLYNIEGVGLYKGTTLISNDGVSKSGDTMTGNLAIISEDDTAKIEFTNTSFDATSTTAPASNLYAGAIDISGSDNYHVGHFRTRHNTSNYFQSQMGVKRSINNTDYEANITVRISPDGTSSCTFPNTTCVDGQWVISFAEILASGTSLNGSTNLSKRIPVPNDNYVYEVLLIGRATTGTTSGNLVRLQLYTNILTSNGALICSARTRANSSVECQGTATVLVKGVASSSTNCTIDRATSFNGEGLIHMIAYRRVGTNS